MATSTLMITAWLLAPLAASAAATEAASTLITATAGSSGSASAGDKVEVSATTRHVTTVPMMSAARPSAKPPTISPWKISALKEMQ